MDKRTDEDLIAGCRDDDKAAWELLVRRYERLIYAIPRRAGLDGDAAADIFQQVFLLLVKNINNINQPAQIQAWLVTTARRETLKHLAESNRSRLSLPIDDPDQTVSSQLTDTKTLPDDVIFSLETQHRVRTALDAIDERCRKLLTMLFYNDQTPPYSEIAVEFGISEGSIGPTRARCLQKMIEHL